METSLIGKAIDFGSIEYGFESHVSNTMTKINAIAHLMNHLKIATNQKSLYFDVHITKRSMQLLNLLLDLNIIRRFYRKHESVYRVYPTYSIYRTRLRTMRTYFKSSHFKPIPIRFLRAMSKQVPCSYLILDTDQGILTHLEALEKGVSGHLIMKID